ncbi:MAG TPA: AAA family ATPase [Niabella sp.]|nr:AAA family ATPase [Niabella sp.]HQW14042.1 AAA family ATPase [Niabella sp.]HQX19415.1 AAA family ATPase [Niabella sp.]HQX40232.1 AAA family ATPase [Niabella sp.]HRB05632.1 AAA family ATPase [Niabella sp.]
MTTVYTYEQWVEDNQQYLSLQVQLIRKLIEKKNSDKDASSKISDEIKKLKSRASSLVKKMKWPPALESLAEIFGLSAFEKDILLICAGVELDSEIGPTIMKFNNNENPSPTFAFALSIFENAYWSAISPHASLRYWRMIELGKGAIVTQAPLKIDENVLHYLTGTGYLNEKLMEYIEPVSTDSEQAPLMQKQLTYLISSKLKVGMPFPVIVLSGRDKQDKLDAAVFVAKFTGVQIFSISASGVPSNRSEVVELCRLWNRDSLIHRHILLLDCNEVDLQDKLLLQLLQYFIGKIESSLIISTEDWMPILDKTKISIDIPKPSGDEQLQIWQSELKRRSIEVNGQLEGIVSQFCLSNSSIREAVSELAASQTERDSKRGLDTSEELWQICSQYTKPALEGLAQRIEPAAHWDDLILPEQQKKILKELLIRVRNRNTVYNKWGFASKGMRGLGISALFAGESGTGKTMASEVLANELKLDLYKIDLSKVVNKYIGETEKNLKKIFDAAEDGGAILLFDEADALFGKRSNVKDSHDRYSNIEVSYLLQRMEQYRGLAILTTNMKSAIDSAFTRRFSAVVNFPFPDAVQRAEIWHGIFPDATPVGDIDIDKLSRFPITGGNIKNIALNAAFLAANEKTLVTMPHILQATKTEYSKMEMPYSNDLKTLL